MRGYGRGRGRGRDDHASVNAHVRDHGRGRENVRGRGNASESGRDRVNGSDHVHDDRADGHRAYGRLHNHDPPLRVLPRAQHLRLQARTLVPRIRQRLSTYPVRLRYF